MIDTRMTEVLGRYLDVAAERFKLVAGNMANVDTPHYHTEDIDFQAEFHSAVQAVDGGAPATPARVVEPGGLVERPDGNNVSMDRESMAMAETQLMFRTGTELLRHEFNRLSMAINADKE